MDLRTDGIRVVGKGGTWTLYPIPRKVLHDLRRYTDGNEGHGHSPTERIFPISEWAVTVCLKRYAKRAGIVDWERVSSHRLRAYFATDATRRRACATEYAWSPRMQQAFASEYCGRMAN